MGMDGEYKVMFSITALLHCAVGKMDIYLIGKRADGVQGFPPGVDFAKLLPTSKIDTYLDIAGLLKIITRPL